MTMIQTRKPKGTHSKYKEDLTRSLAEVEQEKKIRWCEGSSLKTWRA